MHNAWIFPPISLLNISVYRLQPTFKPRYCEKEKDKANKKF
jgi:hypothetical protein